eukprot:gene3996-4350_t
MAKRKPKGSATDVDLAQALCPDVWAVVCDFLCLGSIQILMAVSRSIKQALGRRVATSFETVMKAFGRVLWHSTASCGSARDEAARPALLRHFSARQMTMILPPLSTETLPRPCHPEPGTCPFIPDCRTASLVCQYCASLDYHNSKLFPAPQNHANDLVALVCKGLLSVQPTQQDSMCSAKGLHLAFSWDPGCILVAANGTALHMDLVTCLGNGGLSTLGKRQCAQGTVFAHPTRCDSLGRLCSPAGAPISLSSARRLLTRPAQAVQALQAGLLRCPLEVCSQGNILAADGGALACGGVRTGGLKFVLSRVSCLSQAAAAGLIHTPFCFDSGRVRAPQGYVSSGAGAGRPSSIGWFASDMVLSLVLKYQHAAVQLMQKRLLQCPLTVNQNGLVVTPCGSALPVDVLDLLLCHPQAAAKALTGGLIQARVSPVHTCRACASGGKRNKARCLQGDLCSAGGTPLGVDTLRVVLLHA